MAEKRRAEANAITAVTLKGFKSFAAETRIEIRPLTLLAGANSSGKSSAMQPLLLMKQTEEASFDPGPLLLDGPFLRFTSPDQIVSSIARGRGRREFEAGFEASRGASFKCRFTAGSREGFQLAEMTIKIGAEETILREGPFTGRPKEVLFLYGLPADQAELPLDRGFRIKKIVRNQGFLEARGVTQRRIGTGKRELFVDTELRTGLGFFLRRVIHVPGLRGNPERTYPRAAVGNLFPGPFTAYVASLIAGWQEAEDADNLERPQRISSQLQALGLTSGIKARLVDATRIELLVGLLPKNGKGAKFVNIADVGFGVSQVLPVLVALLTAGPGELVHIEQPELHLHPRAQQALASILADAAKRGVQVVAETHSSTLLLAVQTLVAQGGLDPSIVKLHWFQRDARGATKVTSGDLDELGRYGEWPEDFGDVEADADRSYLNAVGAKAFGKRRKRSGG